MESIVEGLTTIGAFMIGFVFAGIGLIMLSSAEISKNAKRQTAIVFAVLALLVAIPFKTGFLVTGLLGVFFCALIAVLVFKNQSG